jgi:hypothetical protein
LRVFSCYKRSNLMLLMTSLNEGEMLWESVISLLVQRRVMVFGYFRELGNFFIPIRELYYP